MSGVGRYIVSEQFFDSGGGMWALESAAGWMETVIAFCFSPLQAVALQSMGTCTNLFPWFLVQFIILTIALWLCKDK